MLPTPVFNAPRLGKGEYVFLICTVHVHPTCWACIVMKYLLLIFFAEKARNGRSLKLRIYISLDVLNISLPPRMRPPPAHPPPPKKRKEKKSLFLSHGMAIYTPWDNRLTLFSPFCKFVILLLLFPFIFPCFFVSFFSFVRMFPLSYFSL